MRKILHVLTGIQRTLIVPEVIALRQRTQELQVAQERLKEQESRVGRMAEALYPSPPPKTQFDWEGLYYYLEEEGR